MAILTANSSGQINGRFTVPAGVVAGAKLVEFNGSGGSRGTATYTGSNVLVQRTLQQVFQRWWVWPVDPLAQTFTLDRTRQVSGVDLWFTARGNTPVLVQIRATENGFPTRLVLAEAQLTPAQLQLGGAFTRVTFPNLPTLTAGVEYALVVLCDDAVTALSVAQLGKWDTSAGRWVTSQPYQVGVLLSSSNASTWTAHQDMDMAFRLLSPSVSATSRTISLGTTNATNASDLMVLAQTEIPSADCRVDFRLTLTAASNRQITVAAGQVVSLTERYTGPVALDAILVGSATATPVLHPDVQLAIGSVQETANYISREFPANGGTRALVVLDAVTPGSSALTVEIHNGSSWTAVPFVSGTPVEDAWVERTYELTGFSGATARVRLTLTGNAAARPSVRRLRVALT